MTSNPTPPTPEPGGSADVIAHDELAKEIGQARANGRNFISAWSTESAALLTREFDALRAAYDQCQLDAAAYKRCINEFAGDCLPSCDDFAHDDACPKVQGALWLKAALERAEKAEADRARMAADVERLREAIEDVTAIFDGYERLHRAKLTPEGDQKADANLAVAKKLREVLAARTAATGEAVDVTICGGSGHLSDAARQELEEYATYLRLKARFDKQRTTAAPSAGGADGA